MISSEMEKAATVMLAGTAVTVARSDLKLVDGSSGIRFLVCINLNGEISKKRLKNR